MVEVESGSEIINEKVESYLTPYGVEAFKIMLIDADGQPADSIDSMPTLLVDYPETRRPTYHGIWSGNKWQGVPLINDRDQQSATLPVFNNIAGFVGSSKSLGLYSLRLAPNPFSPYDMIGVNKGLQIAFDLSSAVSAYVSVTAKIYNLKGTLVRTISQNLSMLVGNYLPGKSGTLFWDGLTDDNRMAKNGRYILRMKIEDADKEEEVIKKVILIK